jgi:zona occludens toxin
MAINAYCGLPGSGKSYEVVSSVILPAICQGRRVVSNIDGLDNDLIRAYCCEKFEIDLDQLGHIFPVRLDDITSEKFFPVINKPDIPSTVLPGDLVAIDEAFKFWGGDCKIHKEHKEFFREHRHFTHPETGIACDLILMTQHITDLHRILRVVVEQSFVCHKAKGIGRDDLYTITMWEGSRQTKKGIVKDWTQKYKPEIFPLYKSYSGPVAGSEIVADSRQNILNDPKLKYKIAFLILAGCWASWHMYHFFYDRIKPSEASSLPSASSSAKPLQSLYSPDWRVVGLVTIDGISQVFLSGPFGLRAEQLINFKGSGISFSGEVDGQKVNRFSGPLLPLSKEQK